MSSNKDFLPSSSPVSSICTIEIIAILFLFMMNCYKSSIPRMYYNYRIERRACKEPAAMLFTSATRKSGIPPPPVRLSWDSRHPPPENQNFSDQRVTKFSYPWCSASSAKTYILCSSSRCYYPTVLVIVQKARETSTNIPRYCTVGYCTVGYCTVPCARSSCYTCSFLRARQNTEQLVKIYSDTSHRNI